MANNNPYLQRMFDEETHVETHIALAVDVVLGKVEDGLPLEEMDWARIILKCRQAIAALHRLETATLEALAQPAQSLVWEYDEFA